jgi:hypothetical protein
VGAQVRLEGSGNEPAGEYKFFYGKENKNNELGTGFFFVQMRIISAAKRIQFVNDRMSYIILRGVVVLYHSSVYLCPNKG